LVAGSSSGWQSGLSTPGSAAPDSSGGSCGAEAFTGIARFGERKIELLRRFQPYVNGTPSHDHLGDIFATLDARAFQLCFVARVAVLTSTPAEIIAVDGKTSRRSYQTKGSKERSTWSLPSLRGNASC
jgi:DDE_Tnp_1-associated